MADGRGDEQRSERRCRHVGCRVSRSIQLGRRPDLDPDLVQGRARDGLAEQHLSRAHQARDWNRERALRLLPRVPAKLRRVIPADDVQGTIGAAWAKSEGSSRAYVLYDDSVGYGKTLADAFRAKWSSLGQLEVGYERVARADTYLDLARRIVVANADVVYYGGLRPNKPG